MFLGPQLQPYKIAQALLKCRFSNQDRRLRQMLGNRMAFRQYQHKEH
jgi:hypothetical protein